MNDSFLIRPDELSLRFRHQPGQRKLSFANFHGTPEEWREACRAKLVDLLALEKPPQCPVATQRETLIGDIEVEALIMTIDEQLSIPAYLFVPQKIEKSAVIALHGHGEVGPAIGLGDDYHHGFALALAQAGHLVLCPELCGFGSLKDLTQQEEGHRLDYWTTNGHQAYSLCSDGFQHGTPLIGQIIEDLMRWEDWLAREYEELLLDAVGISYGGELALHYGELDKPGLGNHSASFNETVEPALAELRTIYAAFDAEDAVRQIVSPGKGHEMDNDALLDFLAG